LHVRNALVGGSDGSCLDALLSGSVGPNQAERRVSAALPVLAGRSVTLSFRCVPADRYTRLPCLAQRHAIADKRETLFWPCVWSCYSRRACDASTVLLDMTRPL
jgi:hypothetical protein